MLDDAGWSIACQCCSEVGQNSLSSTSHSSVLGRCVPCRVPGDQCSSVDCSRAPPRHAVGLSPSPLALKLSHAHPFQHSSASCLIESPRYTWNFSVPRLCVAVSCWACALPHVVSFQSLLCANAVPFQMGSEGPLNVHSQFSSSS